MRCSPQLQLSNTPSAALQTNNNNSNHNHISSTHNTQSRDQQQQQHPHQLSLLAGVSAAFHSSSSDMPSPPSSALGMQPAATACRPSHYAHAHDADTCMLHHSAPTIPSSSAATHSHAYHHQHQYHQQQHMYMPAAAAAPSSTAAAGMMPPLSSHQAPSLNAHLQNEIYVAPSQARAQARFSEQQFQQHYPTLQQHQQHQHQHQQHQHAQLPSSTGVLGPSYEQQRVDHQANHHQQQQQSSTGVMQQRFITPPTSGSIRATKAQLKVLEKIFLENAMPSGMMHQAISERIGMSKKAVRNWFQNQRAKVRRQEQEDRYLRGQHSPIPDSQLAYQHQGGGGPTLKYHPMHYSQAPAVPHQQQQQGSPYAYSTVHSSHLAAPMSGEYHHPHAQHQTQQLAPLSPPAGGPLRPLQWVLDQHEQQPKQEHFEKRSQQQQQYNNEPPAAQCIETEEGLGISMESSQKVRRNVMSVEALV
ncbi:hypothetical protein HDU77_001569 [Chytriomyces hyalinus]|nr:hypothetical protein HDU77_001569 [Chytriomyces hyalinus]